MTSSTSTLEKSGLRVTSKFKPVPTAILRSPPEEKEGLVFLFAKYYTKKLFLRAAKI